MVIRSPLRGARRDEMKAERWEAGWGYGLSVNSSQAHIGQMRGELGWRALLKEGRREAELKQIVETPTRKKKGRSYMAAWSRRTKACPSHSNGSPHDLSAHSRAFSIQGLFIKHDDCSI